MVLKKKKKGKKKKNKQKPNKLVFSDVFRKFEIGSLYREPWSNNVFIAVSQTLLVTLKNDVELARTPRQPRRYKVIRGMTFGDLLEAWDVDHERIDQIAEKYTHAPYREEVRASGKQVSSRARPKGEALLKDIQDLWRQIRTVRISADQL